ncbi:MAG: TfoX/Sxy family protein [Saprospiraceae bacterium]|nr:TfoX/Sxy family protein [Saprospiraceae bacterium]
MAADESIVKVAEQHLQDVGPVEVKRMFGGVGFFHQDKMFAMVEGSTFRLKVDESNRQDFLDRGMEPFISGKKNRSMPYYEVPSDILNDPKALCNWARKSIALALARKK